MRIFLLFFSLCFLLFFQISPSKKKKRLIFLVLRTSEYIYTYIFKFLIPPTHMPMNVYIRVCVCVCVWFLILLVFPGDTKTTKTRAFVPFFGLFVCPDTREWFLSFGLNPKPVCLVDEIRKEQEIEEPEKKVLETKSTKKLSKKDK